MRRGALRPNAIEALALLLALAIAWTYASPESFRPRRDRRETAESDLAAIGAALATYRSDSGDYPTTAQGLAALRTPPTSPPHPWNWRGPYVLRPLPHDPWGTPYAYRHDAETGDDGYVLTSYGADGRPGGEGERADVIVRR